MTLPVVSIKVYFGVEYSHGMYFTLDDPVKGVLDNATYLLADDSGDGVEVAGDGFAVSIDRGRSRELDEFETGTCTVSLHNFARTYDALNTAGIYYGDLTPGKRVVIQVWGITVYTGVIENWSLGWDVGGDAVATFTAEDALGQLARKSFDAWTATPSEDAGARITAILDRGEVAFGPGRDIGTGVTTLQGDSVTWGSNVLNYAQLVTKSEGGRLYASTDNLVTFRGRYSLVGSTVAATFNDLGTQIPFHGIETAVGAELLYNRVGVDREGGTLQTAEDTASQDAYGVRQLSLSGLLMDSDIQAADMADHLVGIYKDPTPRIASVTVNVSALPASQRTTVTELDIGDLVRVQWTPRSTGPQVDQTAVVEGVRTDVSVDEHYVTLRVAPMSQTAVFILDDPVLGVLDTGPGVLAF